MMRLRWVCAIVALAAVPVVAAASELKLPKEVTPALRAACESDVRRLCIDPQPSPTIEKVKLCVMAKFSQLGKKCQQQIALAGLM